MSALKKHAALVRMGRGGGGGAKLFAAVRTPLPPRAPRLRAPRRGFRYEPPPNAAGTLGFSACPLGVPRPAATPITVTPAAAGAAVTSPQVIARHLPADQVLGLKLLFESMDRCSTGAITADSLREVGFQVWHNGPAEGAALAPARLRRSSWPYRPTASCEQRLRSLLLRGASPGALAGGLCLTRARAARRPRRRWSAAAAPTWTRL